jgi:hypothetical protein
MTDSMSVLLDLSSIRMVRYENDHELADLCRAQAISSKSFGFPDFPECPLSSLLVIDDARTLSTGMLHLVYESRLLELVRTISSAFRKVRTARVADPAQINELLNALSKLQQGISDWRTEVGQEATRKPA